MLTPETYVFPAYAGMSPHRQYPRMKGASFPRLRGDEPDNEDEKPNEGAFSPPTRG